MLDPQNFDIIALFLASEVIEHGFVDDAYQEQPSTCEIRSVDQHRNAASIMLLSQVPLGAFPSFRIPLLT